MKELEEFIAKKVHMGPAVCAADIGDGSERGEYVCQDYILESLGRPHRAVNIMYTYYPNDSQWPARISEACADMEVSFAWDYPYDDYPPFSDDGSQFEQMRDIRMHGQDVMLTITMDCSLTDEQIRDLVEKLRPYGRMLLRINHECNGDWFTHNRRFSYAEVADFFVRFSGIAHDLAPNIRMVFCAGLINSRADEDGTVRVEFEDVFAKAYEEADVWSADKYVALHFGWPYDIAEEGTGTYTVDDAKEIFNMYVMTYERLLERFPKKPLIQAEFNVDGDVTGPLFQARHVMRYYDILKSDAGSHVSAVSMYQFRDRGRLGLEIEDPNNPAVGIKQPLFYEYKKIIKDPVFMPELVTENDACFPVKLRWGGSEDADGVEISVQLSGMPVFCEVTLQEDLSLMLEFYGKWFYKRPGVSTVDLMSAFFEGAEGAAVDKGDIVPLRIFATPADGTNKNNGEKDWNMNAYYVMEKKPVFRIRYSNLYGEEGGMQ